MQTPLLYVYVAAHYHCDLIKGLYSTAYGRQQYTRCPIKDNGFGWTEENRARDGGQAPASPDGLPVRTSPSRLAGPSRSRICPAAKGDLRSRLFLARPRLPKRPPAHQPGRVDCWSEKIDKNRARDARNVSDLESKGWAVCIVWECETADPETLIRRLVRFLDGDTSLSA